MIVKYDLRIKQPKNAVYCDHSIPGIYLKE